MVISLYFKSLLIEKSSFMRFVTAGSHFVQKTHNAHLKLLVLPQSFLLIISSQADTKACR